MAIGMLLMIPGGTKEQYDQVNTEMFGQTGPAPDQLPEGLIMHSAGPAEGGWYIYDVWESKEACQRFMDGPLQEATMKVFGDQPPPGPPPEPQWFEVAALAVAK
jgi:hypothetical protein